MVKRSYSYGCYNLIKDKSAWFDGTDVPRENAAQCFLCHFLKATFAHKSLILESLSGIFGKGI